jgi:hypothetical protein
MMLDVCWLLFCPLKILKFWGKNILLELLFQNETVTLKMKPIITRSCIGWRGERRGEMVVPRSPQDIIERKDGCDE